ncbi:MAG: SpoIIE family protein phosphatase [Sulfuricella sp.]|nr:SpoIIE family protein phosphatase [Sulfuricella sp.]
MNQVSKPPERVLKNFSLLYVEDDDNIREQLEQFLRRRVKEFHVAANGAEGLAAYREHKPDMIISDILMPEMTGLEMAERIKAEDPEVPIILTTAFNETDYFLKAIQIGIDNYVLKPVDTGMLQRALDKSAHVLFQRRELAARKMQTETLLDELQVYHDAAERENQMVAELMDRTVREANLADPLLKSWIAPATAFSGDLVAAQRAPNHDLYVILADATGHGLAAAMNLLPLSRIFYRMVEKGFGLSSMLREMNNMIREQSTADRFVAVTVVRVDERNRIFEVWNGGNPPMVWLCCNGETLRLFKSTNLALGIIDSNDLDLHTDVVKWESHSQLLMFSDGFVEAENLAGEGLGLDALIAGVAPEPAETRFSAAVQVVQQHLAGKPAHDDLSLMVIDCPEPQI